MPRLGVLDAERDAIDRQRSLARLHAEQLERGTRVDIALADQGSVCVLGIQSARCLRLALGHRRAAAFDRARPGADHYHLGIAHLALELGSGLHDSRPSGNRALGL